METDLQLYTYSYVNVRMMECQRECVQLQRIRRDKVPVVNEEKNQQYYKI